MNVLMTCAPGDGEGACPSGSGLSLYEQYTAYGRHDPDMCGYVAHPPAGSGDDQNPGPSPTEENPSPTSRALYESTDNNHVALAVGGLLMAVGGLVLAG